MARGYLRSWLHPPRFKVTGHASAGLQILRACSMLPYHKQEALVCVLGWEVTVAAGADCPLRRSLWLHSTKPCQTEHDAPAVIRAAVGTSNS